MLYLKDVKYMLNEEFEVITLEPVKCEQAEILIKSSRWKKAAKNHVKKVKENRSNGSILDMLIRQSLICFIVLIIFTAINFIGLNNFIENVEQVIENRSIGEYFLDANFV